MYEITVKPAKVALLLFGLAMVTLTSAQAQDRGSRGGAESMSQDDSESDQRFAAKQEKHKPGAETQSSIEDICDGLQGGLGTDKDGNIRCYDSRGYTIIRWY